MPPMNWFIELDLDADPELRRGDAVDVLREWYDGTSGFVRIIENTVEVSDIAEVMELKLRLADNFRAVRKVRAR